MVNAQQWLDEKYPVNRRNEIIELNINEQLEGILNLQDFTNYINRKYPTKEEKEEATKLDIRVKGEEDSDSNEEEGKVLIAALFGLEGSLDLTDFTSLKELGSLNLLWKGNLTSLNLTNCRNLQILNVSNNELSDISFLEQLPNPEKLEELDLSANNITSDLTPFSRFTSLKKLVLGNYYINKNDIKEGKSGFYGSLEPLKKLTELESLDITNNEDIHTRKEKYEPSDANKKKLRKEYEKYVRKNKISEEAFEKIKDLEKQYKEDKGIKNTDYAMNVGNPTLVIIKTLELVDANLKINELIRQSQLEANDADEVLELIPYKQFADIEYLAEGGFGKIYKAKKENKEVVLKSLNDSSQKVTDDFLQEVANHKLCSGDFVVPLYGISQDPETKNYLMVMSYVAEGSLRKYLQKELKKKGTNKLKKLFISQDRQFEKAYKLYHIIRGLNFIHEQERVGEFNKIEVPEYKFDPKTMTSKLIKTEEIVKLLLDPDEQKRALELEIKKMEKEIGKPFTEGQKGLVKEFVQNQKRLLDNKEDEETKKEAEQLTEQLKKENFTKEEISKIINYCERIIDMVQQLEFQTQIEIPPKGNN
ncbi:27405_t:CDS:2 [Gigaspora margarita]|uniref:27405_t:CDS:1 n=1 Tax=Gigaspora margarita TaxID=4874 RepID=A0ABN7VHW6_GIGMA|nr:27405_t:CDS:2 [Gigaspora margarita]